MYIMKMAMKAPTTSDYSPTLLASSTHILVANYSNNTGYAVRTCIQVFSQQIQFRGPGKISAAIQENK